MTKKNRSPAKPSASPNPRPRQRNRPVTRSTMTSNTSPSNSDEEDNQPLERPSDSASDDKDMEIDGTDNTTNRKENDTATDNPSTNKNSDYEDAAETLPPSNSKPSASSVTDASQVSRQLNFDESTPSDPASDIEATGIRTPSKTQSDQNSDAMDVDPGNPGASESLSPDTLQALENDPYNPDPSSSQTSASSKFVPVLNHKKRAPANATDKLAAPSMTKPPAADTFSFHRPVYPSVPPPAPPRNTFYRATWKIDISKGASNPEEGVKDAIAEVWSGLKSADPRFIVYPWKQDHQGKYKPLLDVSKMPERKEMLTRYFKDAYYRPQPGPMYIRVYMGYDLQEEDFGKKAQTFFASGKNRVRIGFWRNQLPFEETVEIGWLYRSTPGMSADTLAQEIFLHCGIHIAARWKIISTDLRGELPKSLQIRAYHISVRSEDAAAAKFFLTRKIFVKHRKSHFIGGSPMRLIPICRDLSAPNRQKSAYFCALQSSFLANIDSMESWEIINVDGAAVGLSNRKLREIILEIPLRDDPSRQAFLSVERSFNSAATKFFFYKAHAAECRSRVTTLLPYLVFTNPSTYEKGIRACFSGDANNRSKGVKWDTERKEVITVDDEIFAMYDMVEDDDEDPGRTDAIVKQYLFDFAEATGMKNSDTLPRAKATKVEETDNISLFSQSTFGHKLPASTPIDVDEDTSNDTPKTVNKSSSTADTVGMSSLTTSDLQAKIDQLSLAFKAISELIPKTPENQAILTKLASALSNDSPGVGNPSDTDQSPGASGSGDKLL